jgi:hypothetical protein
MILKGTEFNLQQIIDQLYGDGILPNLGKKKSITPLFEEENQGFFQYDTYSSQKLIPNNNTILRALVNGFYYILYKSKYPIEIINLGYNSRLQTSLVSYFKGKIISFLRNHVIIHNNKLPAIVKDMIPKQIDNDSLIAIHKSYVTDKHWLLIVWCFHMILDISIFIIDEYNKELYSFASKSKKEIKLRVLFNTYNNLPSEVEVLYV